MAGYRLYGRIGTGSACIEAALAEAGVDFEMMEVPDDAGTAVAQGYNRINPRGQVPALVLPDTTVVMEGPAILLHIADAFPSTGLAPLPGSPARARHDRWLCFFHANLYEGELRRYYPDRYTTESACVESVRAAAEAYVKRHYALFEAEVTPAPYALGETLTCLDLYLWMLVQWIDRDWLQTQCPRLLALTGHVARRDRVAPVHLRHFGDAVA